MLASRWESRLFWLSSSKFAEAFAFASKELNHRHPAERLREIGVKRGKPFADIAENRDRNRAKKLITNNSGGTAHSDHGARRALKQNMITIIPQA